VFKIKTLPSGQIDKHKARLYTRGFIKRYGVDYFDTFAPVIRIESRRILLAYIVVEDLEVHQIDVVYAYLLSELEEDVYLKQLKGLELPYSKVLNLRKGIPGLKQSSKV
jgi:hypothetical protein